MCAYMLYHHVHHDRESLEQRALSAERLHISTLHRSICIRIISLSLYIYTYIYINIYVFTHHVRHDRESLKQRALSAERLHISTLHRSICIRILSLSLSLYIYIYTYIYINIYIFTHHVHDDRESLKQRLLQAERLYISTLYISIRMRNISLSLYIYISIYIHTYIYIYNKYIYHVHDDRESLKQRPLQAERLYISTLYISICIRILSLSLSLCIYIYTYIYI